MSTTDNKLSINFHGTNRRMNELQTTRWMNERMKSSQLNNTKFSSQYLAWERRSLGPQECGGARLLHQRGNPHTTSRPRNSKLPFQHWGGGSPGSILPWGGSQRRARTQKLLPWWFFFMNTSVMQSEKFSTLDENSSSLSSYFHTNYFASMTLPSSWSWTKLFQNRDVLAIQTTALYSISRKFYVNKSVFGKHGL